MKYLRLPLAFDRQRLRSELDQIAPAEWIAHFNASQYEGDWSGVALRAVDGREDQIYPDPTATTRYANTPILARCSYFHEVLSTFQCPLTSARLLRLAAGSSIREHRDYKLDHTSGELRIHIPIVTNSDVAFFLDGERIRMEEGEAWYLNLELPHRVENRSNIDRVHLVIDCVVDDWMRALLETDRSATPATPEAAAEVAIERQPKNQARFDDELTDTIAEFLRRIGLHVEAGAMSARTFVPGIWIDQGVLVIDEQLLRFPGDLLHEAGHLAVVPASRRAMITGDAGSDPAEEMMAIGWSYAAAITLQLDPAVVFHAEGYRGGSASLLENFEHGRYLGVPMLQWLGMTYDINQAPQHGVAPYPHMIQWLRPNEAPL